MGVYALGTCDHYISLKRKYPTLCRNHTHDWSLKEYGALFIYDLIATTGAKRVLEFGNGYNSLFSTLYQKTGIEYACLDNPMSDLGIKGDAERLEKARADISAHGHSYHIGLLGEDADLPVDHYDLIFSISVVEHIDFEIMKRAASHAKKLLRAGGKLANSIDVYTRSRKHLEWHVACEDAGLKTCPPTNLKWHLDGDHATFLERQDIRYLIYNSLSERNVLQSGLRFSSQFATVLHVAER